MAGDPLSGDGATPWRLDALLRLACAAVVGGDPGDLPPAEPRRVPPGRPGDYATALPMRIAGREGRAAPDLAADLAAELRSRPQVVDAVAERPGFVNLTLAPAARVRVVRAAAEGGAYLSGRTCWGASGRDSDAADPWALSALHEAGTAERARAWARADARRRIALAAGPGGAALPPPSPRPARGGDPPAADADWRDPCLGSAPGGTEAARLLRAIGEASARVAFCRSQPERPRPGEVTGPGLPALPAPDEPGNWARHTDANPAFAVRYAHAHAHVTAFRWARDLGLARTPAGRGYCAAAVADLDAPPAAALIGALFDGPGALAAAARRSEPHILVRYLEGLSAAYHEWRESCDAITGESTGRATADGGRGEITAARLDTCAAVAGVLRTGLSLLGVSAPTRL